MQSNTIKKLLDGYKTIKEINIGLKLYQATWGCPILELAKMIKENLCLTELRSLSRQKMELNTTTTFSLPLNKPL